MNSSHPIEIPVGHPSEVDEIFDAISYAKARIHGLVGPIRYSKKSSSRFDSDHSSSWNPVKREDLL